MAKKQIKELVILTRTDGAKEATNQIKSLQGALDGVYSAAKTANRELGGTIKVNQNVGKSYASIADSMNKVVVASRSLNKALNGETKKATQGLSAYIDNLQVLTLYMRDLETVSAKTAKSMGGIGSNMALEKLDKVIATLENSFGELVGQLEDLTRSMSENNRLTKQVRNNLGDLGRTADMTQEEIQALQGSISGVGRAASKTSKNTEKLTNDTRRLGGAGSQGARAFSDLAFRMNPLVSLYASVAVNVYALTEAFRLLNNAANLARLQDQTAKFASSLSGINIKALSSDLQELSGYSISAADALRQTVRGVSYGFLVEDMERLTAGARKASIALGIDFTDAMDRAFRGISKGEVEILDEIGVVTRLDVAYKKYAVTLNKNVDALTDVERRLALTNEVISQLESRFSAFDTAASGMEKLGVATKDALDSILILAATKFDSTAGSIGNYLKGFSGVKSATDAAKESQKIYNEAIREGRYSQAAVALDDYNKAIAAVRKEQTAGTEENKKYTESVSRAKEVAEDVSRVLTVLAIYAIGKVVIALGSATIATYAYITAQLAAARAGKANIAVMLAYNAAVAVKTAAVATLTTVMTTSAVVAQFWVGMMAAALVPIAILAAKLAALGAAVYGVAQWWNYLSKTLFGFDAFAFIGKQVDWVWEKLKKLFSWLGEKAKEAGISIKDGIVSGIDSIGDLAGISSNVEKLLKVDEASLGEVAKENVDQYIARLTAELRKVGTLSAPAFSMELQGASSIEGILPTRKEGEANLMYLESLKGATQALGEEFNNLGKYDTSFNRLSESISSLAAVPLSLNLDPAGLERAKAAFENLKTQDIIPKNIEWGDGFAKFAKDVENAAKAIEEYDRRGAFMLESFNSALDSTDPTANIQSIKKEMELINSVLEKQKAIGDNINSNERQAMADKVTILQIKQEQLEKDRRLALIYDQQTYSLEAQTLALQTVAHYQSDILDLEIRMLQAKIVSTEAEKRSTEELEKQLALLQLRAEYAKKEEARQMAGLANANKIAEAERQVDIAGNATARVAAQQEVLRLKTEEAMKITDIIERTRTLMELGREQAQLSRDTAAARTADIGSVLSSMSSFAGLSDMQSSVASGLGGISTVYSQFLSDMEGSGMSFTDYLKGNIEAFTATASSAIGIAQSIYSQMSASKIEGINQEIAAEQRRDGKSAESLAKIKKLNAQKIKEETKAKKASVIMSTAMAIMQSFAQLGPIAGPFAAAAMAAMGVMQLSNIDKAANGQLAALNSGSGGDLSIAGGNRDNSIDVSRATNAGELAYLRGSSGTGTSSNFVPGRAGGNDAPAGAAITVGESGPEVIVPKVPVSVQSAGSGAGNTIIYSPVYHNQAIDAAGMEDLLAKHSRSVYKGLEQELNANNMSLEDLRR